MKETVISELQAYWEKLCFFWGKFADTARSVAADPGSVNKGDLILMCATLLIVALFVIGEIVRFIAAPWKKKGGMLLGSFLVILTLAIIFYLILRHVQLPANGAGMPGWSGTS